MSQEIRVQIDEKVIEQTVRRVLGGSEKGEIQIVVIDGRWNLVGRVSRVPGFLRIESARVIRHWGTTRGLGELRGGPTEKTKLDSCGSVEVPEGRVVFTMKVDQAAWEAGL